MEYLMQWEFWQEVGLTVAARLSMVAVALWAVKMTVDHLHAHAARPVIAPQSAAAAAPEILGWPGLPVNERIKAYHPLEGRHRPPVFKKPEPAAVGHATPWQEKMAKYLAGEPVLSAGLPRRPR